MPSELTIDGSNLESKGQREYSKLIRSALNSVRSSKAFGSAPKFLLGVMLIGAVVNTFDTLYVSNSEQRARGDELTRVQSSWTMAEVETLTSVDLGRGFHDGVVVQGLRRLSGEPEVPEAVPVLTVLVLTTLMAAASGIGALPFFFVDGQDLQLAGRANALACGVMLAASFDLIHEGEPYGSSMVILGMIIGAWFIKFSQESLHEYEDLKFASISGAGARKTLLILAVMFVHSFGEGAGVGVSFSGQRGWSQGTLVTLAIGAHNIPEGLAVATVLVSNGSSPLSALVWSIVCSLGQPVCAVPSYLFVEAFTALLPLAMGFAAGCMVWMVFAELIPECLEDTAASTVANYATISAASLELFRMCLTDVERYGKQHGGAAGEERGVSMGEAVAVLLPGLVSGAAVWAVASATSIGGRSRTSTGRGAAAGAALSLPLLSTMQSSLPLLQGVAMSGAGVAVYLAALNSLVGPAPSKSEGEGGDPEAPREASPVEDARHGDEASGAGQQAQGVGMPGDLSTTTAVLGSAIAFGAHMGVEGCAMGALAWASPENGMHVMFPFLLRNIPVMVAVSLVLMGSGTPRAQSWVMCGAVGAMQQVGSWGVLVHNAMHGSGSIDVVWVCRGRALAGGMLLAAAWHLLGQKSARTGPGHASAHLGMAVGAGGVLLMAAVCALLCSSTPYCTSLLALANPSDDTDN